MQLVQALILFPDAKRTHCKLGYFLFFGVGLYFPLSFFKGVIKIEPLPQILQTLAIGENVSLIYT